MPLVSIIIPTYNSAKTLEMCLHSLKNQTYQKREIIVVDNYSTDETRIIAERYTKKVYTAWPERTFQKNIWIREAAGKYVCFVDSDMELTEKVIEKSVALFERDESIWWICIPERSVWEWIFVKIRDFERSFYAGTVIESARFFRLDDVEAVGWFEEDLIFFEESILPQKIESRRKKSTKFYIKEYILHHEGDISFGAWLKKKWYYGKSLRQYREKVKEIWIQNTAAWQMGVIGRYMMFLKHKRFYTKPFLAVCVLGLKTLEFFIWWVGCMFSLLFSNHK